MDIRIVDTIKGLCKERGMSIPKLEKEIGLSNGSVYNWNKSYPSIDKLIKVAEYFDVSLDYLTGRTTEIKFTARNSGDTDLSDNDKKILKRLAQVLDMGINDLNRN